MKKISGNYTENENELTCKKIQTEKMKEQIEKINKMTNKLKEYFNFEIPRYVIDEILDNGEYNNICSLINLAVVNERLTKNEGECFKSKLKEICNISSMYDRVVINL